VALLADTIPSAMRPLPCHLWIAFLCPARTEREATYGLGRGRPGRVVIVGIILFSASLPAMRRSIAIFHSRSRCQLGGSRWIVGFLAAKQSPYADLGRSADQ
jgi:hypothetical protein